MPYHALPPHTSTDLFQYAGWPGFSFIYTYWREKPNQGGVAAELQPHVYEAAISECSKPDWVSTAVSQDKKIMDSYIPELRSLTVDFGFLSGNSFTIPFYDPRVGKKIKEFQISKKRVQRIPSPPGEDLLLKITANNTN